MIVETMSAALGLKVGFISSFANGASHAYKTYWIPKRNGTPRHIHHPSKQLKAFQRWLLEYVISRFPVHDAATAYRKQKSIFDNASMHAGSNFLLRMDFVDFFPSIKESDFRAFVEGRRIALFAEWTNFDIEVCCKLLFRNSCLTIGSPTSPALSNCICFDLDARLAELSSRHGVTYTRYADDLFFSTAQAGVLAGFETEVKDAIVGLVIPANLKFNADKTRHSSRKRTRKVTGITLGSDKQPYIGRPLKRKIRALIHKFDALDNRSRGKLSGLLAYASGFDADFLNSLILKYGPSRVRTARFPPK